MSFSILLVTSGVLDVQPFVAMQSSCNQACRPPHGQATQKVVHFAFTLLHWQPLLRSTRLHLPTSEVAPKVSQGEHHELK